MQVRSPLQMYHQSSANSDHSNGRVQYPVSSPDQYPSDGQHHNMNPYQQHPHAGQRQGYPPQLPSMQSNMGMSHMHSGQGLPSQGNAPQYGYAQTAYTLPPPPGVIPAAPQQQDRATSFAGSNGKYKFELRVEQQPQRARMCGFGDKDRRPITPPPCIRLVILDAQTDKVVNIDEVDGSFFVLQVDLWDATASREVNIVRASSSSPAVSISTATTTSYPPTPDRPLGLDFPHHHHHQPTMLMGPDGMPVQMHPGYPPQPHRGSLGGGMGQQYGGYGYGAGGAVGAPYGSAGMSSAAGGSQGSASFTRNLIGSLTVNASRLKDPDGKDGFWFVLQDLSVRTEGMFRLKMNFIDVGNPTQSPKDSNNNNISSPNASGSSSNGGGATINRGRASVLASVFSDGFQVYSAKKFPGVIESTPLSKCFASQGIKIPIRKDVKGERDGDDDD